MTAAFGFWEGRGPMSGVAVLDLSGYVAGPYWLHLAGGTRRRGPQDRAATGRQPANYPSTLAHESRAFLGVNRNKHGIGLDLKNPAGLFEPFSIDCTDARAVHAMQLAARRRGRLPAS